MKFMTGSKHTAITPPEIVVPSRGKVMVFKAGLPAVIEKSSVSPILPPLFSKHGDKTKVGQGKGNALKKIAKIDYQRHV